MHPPRKLDSPEWPGVKLVETWQLATWYLQLVILRLLKYGATYLSRLKLGGSVYDGRPVPWTNGAGWGRHHQQRPAPQWAVWAPSGEGVPIGEIPVPESGCRSRSLAGSDGPGVGGAVAGVPAGRVPATE